MYSSIFKCLIINKINLFQLPCFSAFLDMMRFIPSTNQSLIKIFTAENAEMAFLKNFHYVKSGLL